MKNIKLYLFPFLMLFLVCCAKSPVQPGQDLAGTWEISAYELQIFVQDQLIRQISQERSGFIELNVDASGRMETYLAGEKEIFLFTWDFDANSNQMILQGLDGRVMTFATSGNDQVQEWVSRTEISTLQADTRTTFTAWETGTLALRKL